ncbi:hypothetical protein AWB65_06370 [Caballeronia humi]|jgi:hypothetical protein|uniref:Uncharacterized protein n=1 Tax=Caballeronia humi TaxID=326474 RepID=A0A158JCQ0_9BURK|nr:hypothetical protein AWB65_06370 [Caballeronia humi]
MSEHSSRFLFYIAVNRFFIGSIFNIAPTLPRWELPLNFAGGSIPLFRALLRISLIKTLMAWHVCASAQGLWLCLLLFAYVRIAVVAVMPRGRPLLQGF